MSGSGWISVKERLPGLNRLQQSERVLAIATDASSGCEYVTIARYDPAAKYPWQDDDSRWIGAVSHWQPLPALPEFPEEDQ